MRKRGYLLLLKIETLSGLTVKDLKMSNNKTITYDFKRIKEVKNQDANTLPSTGDKNPGRGESEKVSEHKNIET